MRLRAEPRREREPVADLDALHRLDAHHGGCEPGIEPVGLVRVRPEPRRHAARTDFDDPADGVALRARLVDTGAEPILVDDTPLELDLDRAEKGLRDRARCDMHRRVSGRGALERIAYVGVTVLEDTGQVGVTRPRQRHRLRPLSGRLALRRPGAHPPRPVPVVDVADDERERRAERATVAESGEHLDAVLLDLLPRRAAVPLLPPLAV